MFYHLSASNAISFSNFVENLSSQKLLIKILSDSFVFQRLQKDEKQKNKKKK